MSEADETRAAPHMINRGAVHQALRATHGRASPGATTVIVDALERIAAQLVTFSAKAARSERRRTVLTRHARDAFADFLWPRQGISRATTTLREALGDLEALTRNAPSELPLPSHGASHAEDDEKDDA